MHLLVCYLNKFEYSIEVHAEVIDFFNVKFRNFNFIRIIFDNYLCFKSSDVVYLMIL